jgi:transposase
MARVEVITGPERRRRWSAEQKRAIVAESLAPGAVVTEIARRADICAGQIYRWRREIRVGSGFAPVLIAPAGDGCELDFGAEIDHVLVVGTRQLPFRPNRRYRLRAIRS